MFGACEKLDYVRSCYGYTGTAFGPGGVNLGLRPIVFYFCPESWPLRTGYPVGSHYYDGAGQAIGHHVKPPDYYWFNGRNIINTGECLTCPYGLPELPPCGCLSSDVSVAVNVYPDGGPFTNNFVFSYLPGTSFEYAVTSSVFPMPAGYAVLGGEVASDLSYFDVFMEDPEGEFFVRMTRTGFCDTVNNVWRGVKYEDDGTTFRAIASADL